MRLTRTDQFFFISRARQARHVRASLISRWKRKFAAAVWLFVLAGTLHAQGTSDVQLYFFTSQGCAPCRQVAASIETLKHEGYPVTTVDIGQHPEWAKTFSVDRTPTVTMVANSRLVGRHAGQIDAATLREWFTAVGYVRGVAGPPAPASSAAVPVVAETRRQASQNESTLPATVHQGTAEPANERERQALAATVRLKVQDQEGISYATGTVIHCHEGECLVMTCGHAFREAGHRGKISAEFNFVNGQIESGPGELIAYDAGPRDIALVAVHAGRSIEPVKLAESSRSVGRGDAAFTLGCDGGANPTIRRTKIKNSAIYDGAVKYDIVGRPAIGRSGGGLFNDQGELIGVCNAAAVETDEGIYSALETLHWQLAQANLSHIFHEQKNQQIAQSSSNLLNTGDSEMQWVTLDSKVRSSSPGDRLASNEADPSPGYRAVNWDAGDRGHASGNSASMPRFGGGQGRDQGTGLGAGDADKEVIIIVRSKSGNGMGESITISNPTDELLNYLKEMPDNQSNSRHVGIARMRTEHR